MKAEQVFRVDRKNVNLTEESLASVPCGSGKCEFDGRKQPIGSAQNKKMSITRKKSAHKFRAKQENANRAEENSP